MAARVKQEELVALQQFCLVDRQLKAMTKDNREAVRAATRKRNEAMQALLRTMQTRGVECVAVHDVAPQKYARILMSHTTRQLTPTLVKEALQNHFDELLPHWRPDMSLAELVELFYAPVRHDRVRLKPVVSFSNSLPRGVKADAVPSVDNDSHMQRLVTRMRALQEQHAEVMGAARTKRVELQTHQRSHMPLVDAFLTKRDIAQQLLVSKSGDKLVLRRRAQIKKKPMTVAQFKQLVLEAVEELHAGGHLAQLEQLKLSRDHVIDKLVTCVENGQSIVRSDTIQVVRLRRKQQDQVHASP